MNTICSWYEELSSLSRDIVLQLLCAVAPVPLEQLAQKHGISSEAIQQRRSYLCYSFNQCVADSSVPRGWIAQVELELQKPHVISGLLHRYPWLGESVGGGLTVLRLLTGMYWHDATTSTSGQWIYGSDLRECEDATVQALDLSLDEVISLSTAARLLQTSAVPVPEHLDDLGNWLGYCGFESNGHQLSWSLQEPEVTATPTVEATEDLSQLMQRLTTLLQVNGNPVANVTLGEVIQKAGMYGGELGEVVCRLRDSTFLGGGMWVIPDKTSTKRPCEANAADEDLRPAPVAESALIAISGTSGSTTPIAESDDSPVSGHPDNSAGREQADAGDPARETPLGDVGEYPSPADRIAGLLEGRPEGLSSSLIKEALGAAVSQEQVVKALFGEDRFAITHQGSWYLQNTTGAASPTAEVPEQPLFTITEVVADADSSASGAPTTSARAGACGPAQRGNERLDKIEAVLREVDRPLSIDELKAQTGVTLGNHYLRQQIEADPRFNRSQKTMWALVEWGMPVYKPIKELVSDLVDAHGGAVAADEVIRLLRRDFEIKESSLRQTMSSPPFATRGGTVRRLGEGFRESEVSIPASRPAATAEESGRPVDEAPDVDDLMGKMGLT
ncbi:hypothetical protein OG875_09675 [Streptomyces sp. NBC_01498]|uniref:hypothetical protein n=1 Tax=Streptomyces sp. NBC_01498 TaxID=2975870 RepID=UPI002E7B9331|nr:hypothetical protein [Streptomyces sp. NBC_01498]WTL24844.1 hypothetical protein OG875_09675 [Streptomyces sp. NBC_01498]